MGSEAVSVTGGSINIDSREFQCVKHGPYRARSLQVLGRTVHGKCPQCAAESRQARERDEALMSSLQLRQRLADACIPERFRGQGGASLANYVPQSPRQEKFHALMSDYVAGFTGHRDENVVFFGRVGAGKTYLACAVLHAIIERGYSGYYSPLYALHGAIRDTYGTGQSEAELFNRFANFDLLVLDEIGIQTLSEHEMMVLTRVMNQRYEACRPTLLCGNIAPAEAKTYLGDRVFDRLCEPGMQWYNFDWDSRRVPAAGGEEGAAA